MIKDLINRHKLLTLLTLILAVATSALTTFANLILIYAINAITDKKLSLFILLILGMLVSYLVCSIAGYFSNVLEEKLIQNENHHIRKIYIQKQERLAMNGTINPDKSINLLTNDILLFDQQYLKGFFKLFNCVFSVVFSSVALITLHWSLFLLSVIMTVALMLLPKLMGQRLQRTTKNISNNNDQLLHTLNDWFKGYQDLFWNKALTQIWNQTRPAFNNLENSYIEQKKAQQNVSQFEAYINVASQAAVIALAGILAIKNIVSLGVVVSAGNFAFQMFGAVSVATDSIIMLQSGTSLRDKIVTAIKPTDKKDINVDQLELNNFKSIEAKNLSYKYQNGESIHYPDFSVNIGDKVLITGPSGSGKTTLINLLTGHLSNYQGSLKLNNHDYTDFSKNAFLNIIGLQPQHYHIFNDTILNNITLHNPDFSKDQAITAIKSAQLDQKVNSLTQGLDTIIGNDSDVLSGGELQRVSLARFFIRQQPILIVDEGTSALDKKNAEQVMNILTSNTKLTLFVITHSIDQTVLKKFNKHIELI
ncbi:ABC transporter ATP-binding protein [Companilactobacillus sp. HBUAS56275]|uniref:ABC transporter ATP-binding protein/permease n=1 Tax=Candidatus Companilactobacillus pullicola TaxID=2838523 RepID=A0A9D1ZLK4_9LACO|nr:ABC transporter ATP-binding protein/permease [Candidatus Companilactobacillus pullicola]